MVTRDVAMRLFIRARRHLGYMRMHRAVRQQKYQTAAACAAVGEIDKLDFLEIGNEVGFPGVISLPHQVQFPFAGKILLLSESIVEVEIVVEHEPFVVKEIEHHRQVGCADEQRALKTTGV